MKTLLSLIIYSVIAARLLYYVIQLLRKSAFTIPSLNLSFLQEFLSKRISLSNINLTPKYKLIYLSTVLGAYLAFEMVRLVPAIVQDCKTENIQRKLAVKEAVELETKQHKDVETIDVLYDYFYQNEKNAHVKYVARPTYPKHILEYGKTFHKQRIDSLTSTAKYKYGKIDASLRDSLKWEYYRLGVTEFTLYNLDTAFIHINNSLALDSTFAQAKLMKARITMDNNWNDALSLFEEIKDSGFQPNATKINYAVLLTSVDSQKGYDYISELLRQPIGIGKESINLYRLKANLEAYHRNDLDQAIKDLNKVHQMALKYKNKEFQKLALEEMLKVAILKYDHKKLTFTSTELLKLARKDHDLNYEDIEYVASHQRKYLETVFSFSKDFSFKWDLENMSSIEELLIATWNVGPVGRKCKVCSETDSIYIERYADYLEYNHKGFILKEKFAEHNRQIASNPDSVSLYYKRIKQSIKYELFDNAKRDLTIAKKIDTLYAPLYIAASMLCTLEADNKRADSLEQIAYILDSTYLPYWEYGNILLEKGYYSKALKINATARAKFPENEILYKQEQELKQFNKKETVIAVLFLFVSPLLLILLLKPSKFKFFKKKKESREKKKKKHVAVWLTKSPLIKYGIRIPLWMLLVYKTLAPIGGMIIHIIIFGIIFHLIGLPTKFSNPHTSYKLSIAISFSMILFICGYYYIYPNEKGKFKLIS